jgi:hypothetical protein
MIDSSPSSDAPHPSTRSESALAEQAHHHGLDRHVAQLPDHLLTSGLRMTRGEGASRKWKGAVEIRQWGRGKKIGRNK